MTFTASNGVAIDVADDLENALGYDSGQIQALREFFQHERDEELGRWRWPENPDYVVYPDLTHDHEVAFGDGLTYTVLRESDGVMKGYARAEDDHRGSVHRPHDNPFALAARAYFAAHPEPKPWHDAQPGEVWVLTTENVGDEIAARVADLNEMIVFEYIKGLTRIAVTDTRIVTGRRIWPEVTL